MRTLQTLFIVGNLFFLLSSLGIANGQEGSCDILVGECSRRLPSALNQGSTAAINVLLQVIDNFRDQNRRIHLLDNSETRAVIQSISFVAPPPPLPATQPTLEMRLRTLDTTARAAVEKAANDYKPKAVTAVVATVPPVVTTILTSVRSDCMSCKASIDAATNTQRTALNALVVEAMRPLTAPGNIRSAVFVLLQSILSSNQVDFFWPRLELFLRGQLLTLNNQKTTCLRTLYNSIVKRINADPNRQTTRMLDLLQLQTILDTFRPTQSSADGAAILASGRSAAQTAIDAIKALPVGSPARGTAIITFLTTYSQEVSDRMNTNQAMTNTNFNTAVTNMNRVLQPSNTP